MCLYIASHIRPIAKVATQNITVYKILLHEYDTTYFSPYYHFEWKLDTIYTAEKEVELNKRDDGYDIEGGVFHSFKNFDQAVDCLPWVKYDLFNAVLFEAVIPKGTEYWTGRGHNSFIEYASKALKISQRV